MFNKYVFFFFLPRLANSSNPSLPGAHYNVMNIYTYLAYDAFLKHFFFYFSRTVSLALVFITLQHIAGRCYICAEAFILSYM